jgi:hypothetical protein
LPADSLHTFWSDPGRCKKIVAMDRGVSFDPADWGRVRQNIDKSLFDGSLKVGRDYSFSSFHTSGSWRGHRSGVQILPPPDNAPSDEGAEKPFILEFTVKASDLWRLTNYRHIRERHDLTFLLNVLLAGRVTFQSHLSQHFWAMTNPRDHGDPKIQWVQQCYFAPLDEVITDELSPPATEMIQEIEPDQYYGKIGQDGNSLRVPTDLDDLICRYQQLSDTNRSSSIARHFGCTSPPAYGQFRCLPLLQQWYRRSKH